MKNNLADNISALIKNWFYKLNNKEVNESILVLVYSGKFEDLVKCDFLIKQTLQVYYSNKQISYSRLDESKTNQVIIIDPLYENLIDFSKINKKMIVVDSEHIFFKNMQEFVNPQNIYKFDYDEIELNSACLKKEEISLLIANTNSQHLRSQIENRLFVLKKIYKNINFIVTQGISIEKFPNENLFTDIDMLFKHNVLTSRLAVIIYRIFTLDINANITKIGRAINEITGTKSKSFTDKMLQSLAKGQIITISQDLVKKKVFKAYNLNVNDAELAIRIEIANELLSYDLKEMTTYLISKATKLPIETIKKLDFN